MINMLRLPVGKTDNREEQTGNVNRRMESLRIKKRC